MLLIHERTVGDVTILDLEGTVLIDGSDEPYETIADLIKRGRRKVLLNVAGVTYWDSACLGPLVRSGTTLMRAGGILRILSPPTQLRSLLESTKLADVFQVFDDEEAALRSFREPERE